MMGIKELCVLGVSEPILKSMMGEQKVVLKPIRDLHERASESLKLFDYVEFDTAKRQLNGIPDCLSKYAMDFIECKGVKLPKLRAIPHPLKMRFLFRAKRGEIFWPFAPKARRKFFGDLLKI